MRLVDILKHSLIYFSAWVRNALNKKTCQSTICQVRFSLCSWYGTSNSKCGSCNRLQSITHSFRDIFLRKIFDAVTIAWNPDLAMAKVSHIHKHLWDPTTPMKTRTLNEIYFPVARLQVLWRSLQRSLDLNVNHLRSIISSLYYDFSAWRARPVDIDFSGTEEMDLIESVQHVCICTDVFVPSVQA